MDDTKTVDALFSEPETNPSTMDGGDPLSKPSGEEKEVPVKACNVHEEENECAFGVNDKETANAEVTNKEHMIEEIEEGKQVNASANKNANKSTKRGKKVKAKTRAATRRKTIAKITNVQEPSDKGMEEEADCVAGGEENKLMKQGVEEENTNEGMTIKEDAEVSISVGAVEQKEEVNNNENAGVDLANEKNMEVVVNNGENAGEDVVKAASINEVVKGEQVKPVPENGKRVEVVNNGENAGEDVVKTASMNEVVKGEEVKPVPENPVNKSRKARLRNKKKKKNTLNSTAALVPKNGKEPESSEKKTSKTTGMIFMCSSKTKKDCYQYKVLGLPASKRDLVLNTVFEGMKLFLFDVDLKLLYGIYKAAGPGGYNIEPKAFKAAFPSQVRFAVHEDCLPIPEEKFRGVIKDNYYQKNKFSCELTSEQVRNLCKLFQNASKILKPKRVLRAESRKAAGKDKIKKRRNARAEDSFPVRDGSRKRLREAGRAETHTFVDRERSRKRRREFEKHPAYGRNRVYSDGLDAYERQAHISPVPTIPLHHPLPPPISAPALPPRYAYDRDVEMNIPRRPLLVERHDNRQYLDSDLRRQQHVDYGREALDSYRDRWYRDVEPRRLDEPYPYYIHRERLSYYDQVNSAAPSSSYYPSSGISRDTAALPREYQPPPLPEYQPLRSTYRY